MRNFISKFALMLLVLFVGISLGACDDSKTNNYNNKVAYGTLSDTTAYATLGNLTLSQKGLYDELRGNGYDYLIDEMLELLVPSTEYKAGTEWEDELKAIVDEKCYGTTDTTDMTKAAKKLAEEKFADQMYMVGINIRNTEGGIDIYNPECLNYFSRDLARKEYARTILNTPKYYWENEFQKDEDGNEILDEDGEKIKNPYYISDDTIESTYNSTKNSETPYNVVIIKYDTLQQAQNADSWDSSKSAYENFADLYYARYSYKSSVDKDENGVDDNFELTSEDLSAYDTSLVSLIKSINKNFTDLNGKTYKLNQQFGNYVYSVYLNKEYKDADYAKLPENIEEGAEKSDKQIAKEDTVKEIIENKLTSSTISSLLLEELYDAEVVINDYVFDALYSIENEKHTRLAANKFSNDFLVSVGGSKLTVEAFYATLEKVLGVSTAMDYFTSKTLLTSAYAEKVTSEDETKYKEEMNKVISAFENGDYASSGFPTSIGKDVFMFVYFGSTSESEVEEFYRANKAWEYFVADQDEAYFNAAYEFGKEYAGYTVTDSEGKETPVAGKYFDLSVKHILLTVDYNGDGKADDPELFMNKLTDAKKEELLTNITETMLAIVKEVNYIVDNDLRSLLEALDFIKDRFNTTDTDDAKLLSNPSKTWIDYRKEFNLGLTIEDLGSVNNSNVSQYVSEFGIGVKQLYTELKAKADNDKDFSISDDYLYGDILKPNTDSEGTETPKTEAEQLAEMGTKLIKTSFGYHILASYNSSTMTSAKYLESSDSGKQYQNIKVEINGEEVTDLNGYSDQKYASISQIKIYEGQLNTDEGIDDLPPGAKTFIGKFYSDFKSKYTNSTFKNILYAHRNLSALDFADDANDADFKEFIRIQKREFDSYSIPEVNDLSIFANWWEIVLK